MKIIISLILISVIVMFATSKNALAAEKSDLSGAVLFTIVRAGVRSKH
jgi:hypothetical protein